MAESQPERPRILETALEISTDVDSIASEDSEAELCANAQDADAPLSLASFATIAKRFHTHIDVLSPLNSRGLSAEEAQRRKVRSHSVALSLTTLGARWS